MWPMLDGLSGENGYGLESFLFWFSVIIFTVESAPEIFFWLLRKFGTPRW